MDTEDDELFHPYLELTALEAFGDPAVAQLADAAVMGDLQALAALLRQGVNVQARTEDGMGLFRWTYDCWHGGFYWSDDSRARSFDGMVALLQAGADHDLNDDPEDPQNYCYDYDVMLEAIAHSDDTRLLKALLDAGVNPNLRNPGGQTALFDAITYGKEAAFQLLLAAGADPNAKDDLYNPDKTPLLLHAANHDTGSNGTGRYTLTLLEAGADPYASNAAGRTFQPDFKRRDATTASDAFIQNKRKIAAWLRAHGVPLAWEDGG